MTEGNPPNPDQGGFAGSDQPAGTPGPQPGEPDWYAPFTPDASGTPGAAPPGYLPPWPGQPAAAPPTGDPGAAGSFAQGPWGGAAGPADQGPYGGAPGSAAQGQFQPGQYAQGPYGGVPPTAAGPYGQGPYGQGPYGQGPYGGPGPNFPMAPPGWQMYAGRRRMGGAYLRRRAITHITMGFILLIVGIAVTAGSYAAAANNPNGGGYFITFGLIVIGFLWVVRGFSMLIRSSRLP